LRRDLHDGLGPTLGSPTLKLDVARDLVDQNPAAVRALLNGLKTQAQDAVTDIRPAWFTRSGRQRSTT
jgi:signal transduction histidine kinase